MGTFSLLSDRGWRGGARLFIEMPRHGDCTQHSTEDHPCTKTLPKAQRTRGLSLSYQSNFLRAYYKFKHKSWSHFIFRISTKHQLKISTKHQHLHATQNSKSWPNLAAESRPRFNFITSTKHQRQNAEQTAASNLAWTSTSKSWPTLVLKVWTKI